ncbi:unnamed protein product, partial [Choristocarpus tenellus]
MLRERGYQPVEDDRDDESGDDMRADGGNAAYSFVPTTETALGPSEGSYIAAGIEVESSADIAEGEGETVEGVDASHPSTIVVKILNVQGQTYPLAVAPLTTIRQLKVALAAKSGVEVERQRIIHGGK